MRLESVKPTSHQKTVLAIVANAATPKIALEELSGDANTNTAAELLVQLGALTMDEGGASLTSAGEQLARDENITDESGALTTNGTMYLKMHRKNNTENTDSLESDIQESDTHAALTLVGELVTLIIDAVGSAN